MCIRDRLCATAVAAGKYFGWQDVLNAGPEQMTDSTEPLAVQVDAGDITLRVTEALADERVLYLLWEMQAPAAIFGDRSTVDGRLDFGEEMCIRDRCYNLCGKKASKWVKINGEKVFIRAGKC